MKIDLHNHLGKNGKNPGFDETIDLIYKKLGSDSMFGICNCTSVDYRFENFVNQKGKYERIWLGNEKKILCIPEKNMYLIGCEEVQSKEGHLVVAGMPKNKKIQKDNKILSLEDALKSADDLGGIKIIVHPFSKDGWGIYPKSLHHYFLCKEFDGWEVYNASAELAVPGILPFNANKESIDFYNFTLKDTFDIGACAFTDGHSVNVIGRSYTDLRLVGKLTVEYLKNAIKQNKNLETLHMKPAKLDALKHAYNMVMHKIFGKGA